MEPGAYVIYVQKHAYSILPNPAAMDQVLVVAAGGPTGSVLEIPGVPGSGSMGSVEVQVTSDDGSGVVGALVVAIGEETIGQVAPSSYGHTDDGGVALVANLPEGAYTLIAYRTDIRTKQVQSVSVVRNEVNAAEIDVSTGPFGDLEIEFTGLDEGDTTAWARLLHVETGQPIPGTRVPLEGGLWSVTGVAPGTYLIDVMARERVVDPEATDRESWYSLSVKTGTNDGLTVPLVSALSLTSPVDGADTSFSPEFTWTGSGDHDFYNVEVRNAANQVVYGGFALDGTSRLEIDSSVTKLTYGSMDFAAVDPSYIPADVLTVGWYRWRVYGGSYDAGGKHGYLIGSASDWSMGKFSAGPEDSR